MNWLDRHRRWAVPIFFVSLVVFRFGSLLWSTNTLPTSGKLDMLAEFYQCRAFAFDHISSGHLPLWNPHSYGGEPFVGNFLAAEFYPPNWLLVVLPTATGINWILALHLMAAGYFTYLWARGRGISVAGATIAGCAFMFSGPYFLHIYGGHLPHLSVMVWAPLIFLSVDGLARDGSRRWALLGMTAVGMEILAGHPQYIYYTCIAVGFYGLVSLSTSSNKRSLLIGIAAIYLGAACLAAIQLFPGIEATRDSIRGGQGMDFAFAASMALRPLNWITVIAPQWLGAVAETSSAPSPLYWSYAYQWEASVFVGVCVAGLVLLSLTELRKHTNWPLVATMLLTGLLAMGRFTPLYRLMYDYFPGYNAIRGTSKFAYLVTLAMAVLAGAGFDVITSWKRFPVWIAALIATVGAAAWFAGTAIESSGQDPHGSWARLLDRTAEEGQQIQELYTWLPPTYRNPKFIVKTAERAAQSTRQVGTILLLVAGVVFASRYRREALVLLVVIVVAESMSFANQSWTTTLAQPPAAPAEWENALAQLPEGERVLISYFNAGEFTMWSRRDAVWGYDAFGLKRWAEFMYAAEGRSAAQVSQYLSFDRVTNLFQLTRCRFVLTGDPKLPVILVENPMATAQLVGSVQVIPDRDHVLAQLADPSFNARRTVLLEQPPSVTVGGSAEPGSVTVLRRTTDELELQAQVNSPAVLLVTDAYCSGWNVESIGPSTQSDYELLPADWAMRGVPLQAGSHHLLMYYLPLGYRIGRWVTLFSLLGYVEILRRTWSRLGSAAAMPLTNSPA